MSLVQSYKNTHYNSDINITLIVDTDSKQLDELLKDRGMRSAIYITAWNPLSESRPIRENQSSNENLKDDLLTITSEENIIMGFGESISNEVPGEESFLVLGLSKEIGNELAYKYQQNAFILHQLNSFTELVITDHYKE